MSSAPHDDDGDRHVGGHLQAGAAQEQTGEIAEAPATDH